MSNFNASVKSASATSNKTLFVYDHINRKIIGTERNFKLAGIPNSDACKALMAVKAGQPTYALFPIPSKNKVAKKQTYAGLTRDLITEYVGIFGNDAQKAELDKMVNDNEAYPAIKSWFLDYFKAGFTAEKAKREIANHKLSKKKATVRKVVKQNMQKAAPAAEMPQVVNF